MDYRRFIQSYPDLYQDFGTPQIRPVKPILPRVNVRHMTTACKATLLNFAVSCMDEDEIYLEAGVWKGGTMLFALLDNSARGVGIDNWSEFNEDNDNREVAIANLSLLGDRVRLIDSDISTALKTMSFPKIGVYNYDAGHGWVETVCGVVDAFQHLHHGSLIFVDDTSWVAPRKAINTLLDMYPNHLHLIADFNGKDQDEIWATGVCVFLFLG